MNTAPSPNAHPKIAFWFRYGPAEHAQLFHGIPNIVETLAQEAEVHYFGFKSERPVPDRIARNATVHHLPFTVDRTRAVDKWVKTLLWILLLPFVALRCRFMGIRAVYIDETVPLTAPIARLFFGPRVAFTIADFFLDIYSEQNPAIRALGGIIKKIDYAAWRHLPVIFTRAKYTRTFLSQRGIPAERIHPVYDPCDLTLYRPADRAAARRALDLPADAIILVHHGILHPNKGNDRIVETLHQHKDRLPDIHYLLIGDGPEMPRLRALVKSLNLTDRVHFTGWLETLEEVNTALNAGDIGLVMRVGQEADDFHMTGALVHSMACGLPILAARLAGVAEVVEDGKNGYLFDPRTMTNFAERLEELARDAALRERLGAQALADARRHFDMASVTQQTVTPLLELLRT